MLRLQAPGESIPLLFCLFEVPAPLALWPHITRATLTFLLVSFEDPVIAGDSLYTVEYVLCIKYIFYQYSMKLLYCDSEDQIIFSSQCLLLNPICKVPFAA